MTTRYLIALLMLPVATLIVLTGCQKSDNSQPLSGCDTANTTFNGLYTNLLNSPDNIDGPSYDGHVHSYTFRVTSKESICKIGYQNLGHPRATLPDLIELYDSTTNNMLYTGSHFFDSSNISYLSINPVILVPGRSYTIKRTRNYGTYVTELIGRLVRNKNSQLTFPVTFKNLQITSSSFYQYSPSGFQGASIPYIDLVFE